MQAPKARLNLSFCLIAIAASALSTGLQASNILAIPGRPTAFPLPRPAPASEAIAWGSNGAGQILMPAAASNVVAVAVGGLQSAALRSDGNVVVWGINYTGQLNVPTSATNIVAIASGDSHFIALRANGTVVCWGNPADGRTIVPVAATNVVSIAAAGGHSLVLKSDGTVLGWGWNPYGQATPPAGLTNIVSVAAGYSHSAALRADGKVFGWGSNSNGQTNVPAGLTNVVAISAGGVDAADGVTLALKGDGTVVGWGDNSRGQLQIPPAATNILRIASGYYTEAAIQSTGKVFVWGDVSQGEGNVPVNLVARSVSVGDVAVMALTGIPLSTEPRQAILQAQVVNGFVVGVTIVEPGYGYTDAPVVTLAGGAGSGASISLTVANGSITTAAIQNPGSGYSSTTTINVTPPPFDTSLEIAISRVKVTMQLIIGVKYQVETSTDLTHWTSVGSVFTPTSSQVEQEFLVDQVGRFFRVTAVP